MNTFSLNTKILGSKSVHNTANSANLDFSSNKFSDNFLNNLLNCGIPNSGEHVQNPLSDATNIYNLPPQPMQTHHHFNVNLPQSRVQCQSDFHNQATVHCGVAPTTLNQFNTTANNTASLPFSVLHSSNHNAQMGETQSSNVLIPDGRVINPNFSIDKLAFKIGQFLISCEHPNNSTNKENHSDLTPFQVDYTINLINGLKQLSPDALPMFIHQTAANKKLPLEFRLMLLEVLNEPCSDMKMKTSNNANAAGASLLSNSSSLLPVGNVESMAATPQGNPSTPDFYSQNTQPKPAGDLHHSSSEVLHYGYEEPLPVGVAQQYEYNPDIVNYQKYPSSVTPEMNSARTNPIGLDHFNSLPDADLHIQTNLQVPSSDQYQSPEHILYNNVLYQQLSNSQLRTDLGSRIIMPNNFSPVGLATSGQFVPSPMEGSNFQNTFTMDPSFPSSETAFARPAQQFSNSQFERPYHLERSSSQDSSFSIPSLTSSAASSPTSSLPTPEAENSQFAWDESQPFNAKAPKVRKPRQTKKPYSRPATKGLSSQDSYVVGVVPDAVRQSNEAEAEIYVVRKQKNDVRDLTEFDPLISMAESAKPRNTKGKANPVVCLVCEKVLTTGINRHMLSHSRLGDIVCPCGRNFARIDSFKRHLKEKNVMGMCLQREVFAQREETIFNGLIGSLKSLSSAGRGSLEDSEFKLIHETAMKFRLACQNAAVISHEDADQATLDQRETDIAYVKQVYSVYAPQMLGEVFEEDVEQAESLNFNE